MSRLILASASPRRRELLAQAGFVFEAYPAHIPEEPREGEDPIAYVTRLAREKAQRVFRDQGPGVRDLVVVGADTTVTLDGHILEKPRDAEDAARMLRMLSGRTHRVITGVAVVSGGGGNRRSFDFAGAQPHEQRPVRGGPGGRTGSAQDDSIFERASSSGNVDGMRVEVAAEVTAVRFLTLSDEEIAAYVASGEPMDKAGAYAIQGRAAKWIPRVDGCYFNVVGLPLALVAGMLEGKRLGRSGQALEIRD